MRRAFLLIVFVVGAIGSAHAQVITGESQYEDNFHHTPPDGGAKMPTPSPPPKVRDDESERLHGRVYPNDRGDDPSNY